MSQFAPATWVIHPEEKSKNEVIFNSLKPNNGKLSGDQAKKYLMLSNLPTPTLGHIWQLSDFDNDGKMTLQEFTIAVHLVQAKCRGIEVPKVLPYSLKSSSVQSQSVFGGSANPPGLSHMNNGAISMPTMSLGMQSGSLLTPLAPNTGVSNISSSFSTSNQFAASYSAGGLSLGSAQSNFSTAANTPPGFHTGLSGSSTFPRNMHHAHTSTPYGSGMSSLDSLGLMSASNWNQKDSFQQKGGVTRAASLGPAPAAHGPSQGVGKLSGSNTPAGSSQDSMTLGGKPNVEQMTPANRLMYTQIFKATDHEKNGFIRGEQARQLLIQSGISPDKLVKIWDLSDLNKDGNLDLDEFVIAMHLIDLAKSGQSLPATLPAELIPATKNSPPEAEGHAQDTASDGKRGRSESISSIGKPELVTFEDRRKLNYEKGRQELERRRKEIQDKIQREKEERERKEKEEEERKRRVREEAERRRQQQIENERRQREETEREQEAQRKKLIEQRHAAQLEAERQRQKEWEQRRKEELLHQKGLEEDIVKGLKLRLEKLKGELTEATAQRDSLAGNLQSKKSVFNELMASIAEMGKSRSFGQSQITQYLNDIQKMRLLVTQLKGERERLSVEINKRDSTTTSEALGGVRASIQQTKLNIPRLKGHLVAIEAERDDLLKENDLNRRQIPTIKTALQTKVDENNRYKHALEQKKKEYLAFKQRVEEEARRVDAINRRKKDEDDRNVREMEAKRRREEMLKKQKDDDRRKQKEKEHKAMKLEQQRQEESMRRIHDAQAAEKHSKMEMAKQVTAEAVQKKQNLKAQQKVAAVAKSSEIQDLFMAASVVNSSAQGPAQPIPPPKKNSKSAAPPRPKTRPVVAAGDRVLVDTAKAEEDPFGNWNAIANLDSSRQQPEADLMQQLKEVKGKIVSQTGEKGRSENELQNKLKEEQKRREEERQRQGETKKQQRDEEDRKKAAARNKLEEEKRKQEEALQRRKEDERRKGEAERRRWEEELKRRKEKEKEGEEAMLKMQIATKKAREQERLEIERKEREEERKQKEKEEVQRKVEEMQKMKRMKKQQQQQESSPVVAQPGHAEVTKTNTRVRYKALFPFEARHSDELSILDGDLITVDESDSSVPPGWFRGTCGGETGLFPSSYVEKMPQDTFTDYVELDKNAKMAPVTATEPIMTNFPNENKDMAVISASKQHQQQIFNEQQQQQLQNNQTQQQEQELQPPQVAPKKKTALVPKTNALPKISDDLKARAGSLSEAAHDRTASFGSAASEGTDGSHQDSASQGSVKSTASSLGKRECYENVVPPFTIEGPSATEETIKVPEGLQAVALYPYRGKKEEHLTFNKNDQIIVLEQQDMWWYGESNSKSGWFPKSYVKIIGTIKAPALMPVDDACDASSVASSTSSVATEHSGGEQNYVGECIALFDYVGLEGDLSFSEGDVIKITKKESDWWEGVLRNECGFFPANYVKVKEQPEALKKPEVATVISQFTASDVREISLSPGQLIHVLKKDQGGWWQGELQARGKKRQVGWFPASHVKLLVKSTEPTVTNEQQPDHDVDDDVYAVPQKRENPAEQVLALFSYTAQNEDELTFYKGSVINVISRDGDWWRGELNGQVGMFPYNYVQLLSDLPDNPNQWEGSFDSAVLKSMTKSDRQRQNYIHELINTEQIFMDDLSLTLEIFYNPMAETGVLTEQELNTVFVNWREIIMCNTKLLKALLVRKTMSVNNKVEAVGDILVEQIPRLTPYIRFCSCQIKACKLLQRKVENDAGFKQFEKKCAGDPRLRQNLPLSSYLLKPLQRITKYPLIIKQIIKYTPEDHHDRPNLEQASEQIQELCSQINENIRMVESSSRLEWLQSHVNLEGLGEKLVFNSQTNCVGQRKYIHHSTLFKHKSNKELRGFLFNDFLLLARQHGTSQSARTFTTIFKDDLEGEVTLSIYKKPIFLNEIVVKLPMDSDVNETLFCLSHIDRIYTLRTETRNERNTWLSKLQKASENFIETERFQRKRAHRARSVLGQGIGRLTVMIIEGFDLQASDPTGTSDPYCEVSMGSQEHKTKVIPKTLNPKWNSQMIFTVKDIDQDVLCISVFDRDFFSPNDFLGRTELSISSLLKEGPGPWTKRLLLHEVSTGEIVLRASFQKFEKRK